MIRFGKIIKIYSTKPELQVSPSSTYHEGLASHLRYIDTAIEFTTKNCLHFHPHVV